jgi:putative ABC transport system substrate-binding protein
MMDRRAVVCGLASLIGAPTIIRAQQAGKLYRVGAIFTTSPVSEMVGSNPIHPGFRAFTHALRAMGYVEGQNLILERRSAEGRFERFGEILAELVQRKVDVILTTGDDMAQVAKRVTTAVPIVMANSYDPIAAGIVASLARPGGNVTGLTVRAGVELETKRLQILKEALPEATLIAVLAMRSDWEGPQGINIRAGAQMLGLTLVHAEHTATHYGDAFALMTRERPHALFVARHPANYANRQLIVDFTVEQRIPGMYQAREFVEAGGLMSYGTNIPDLFAAAAGYVHKILKGAAPGDLPIEQPTKFELVINSTTAKALGITIPPSILLRADEVIE